MSELFQVTIVLCCLLVFVTGASFIIISKLVNKLMSRSYFDYLDAEKNLKKPKTKTIIEDQLPTENIARVF